MTKNKIETLINFPRGIPGFEECKAFKLIEDEDPLLADLVSVDNKQARFIVFRSQLFFADYLPKLELAEKEAALLEIREDDTPEVWTLLTLCQSDLRKTTANLRAPIIINRRACKGAQFILSDERYSSRQPVFKPQENAGAEDCNLQERG